MRYKGKVPIKALIAAGLLALNLSGCKRENQENSRTLSKNTIEVEQFKEKLQTSFSTFDVTLDKSSNKFISSIVMDGTNVSIELVDGSNVSGTLYNLEISNVEFENFYMYDSQYIDDVFNVETVYQDYKEKGYNSSVEALFGDYENHKKLNLETKKCSVNNEYKWGLMRDIKWHGDLDYSDCKKLWLENIWLDEKLLEKISLMPNLETLILTSPDTCKLDEEIIEIHSNSLKNIIIDVSTAFDYVDQFDFTGSPNLEIVSISGDTQETNLNGLKGLTKLRKLAFGLPLYKYDISGLILNDFQERIDLVSTPFPVDNKSLYCPLNCFISDISAINGSSIEILNVSFLGSVSSDMLLETVMSLPNLKQIVGFEINNAGMCSDELIRYCKENGIQHPFTDKSLEIKHKLQEIVSDLLTEDMEEEEKIKALSEYIVSHMEYDWDLMDKTDESPEKIKKGWGECLYHSVIEEEGVCRGYTVYAQNLFTEAGITSFKSEGVGHTWNLVQIDNEYYFVDLTNIDELVNEEKSSSFDDYNLEAYYLVPVEDENFFYTYMLPIEAEEKYNEARESKETEGTEKVEKIKLEKYMICGIIGILCALGLAKKAVNKEKALEKNLSAYQNISLEKREDVIKVSSLNELLKTLKRIRKMRELRSKREIADMERMKNKKAKELEREATQMEKGANTR